MVATGGGRRAARPTRAEVLLDDDGITLAGLLLETASGLQQRMDEALRRDANLPVTTYEVLIRLARSPAGMVRSVDLGRELAITTGGVTRLVDRLEAQGLVRRSREGPDRRAVYAKLTPAGRRTLLRALPGHVEDLAEAFGTLEPAARTALEDALRTLRAVVCYRDASPWLRSARQAARPAR